MKILLKTTLASAAILTLIGCTGATANVPSVQSAAKLDVKTACNPNMSVAEHLATAKKFNPLAVNLEIEFQRFKVPNSKAIAAIEKTIKEGKTEVALLKKQKYTLTSVKDAAWRTCVFAIRPLQLHHQAKTTTPLAIPGHGFKY